jgi:YidC/Oxa1 family membrane protein insertase
MEKKNRFAFIYLIIGVLFLFGWGFIQNKIWPPQRKATESELIGLGLGTPVMVASHPSVVSLAEAEREEMAAEELRQRPNVLGTLATSAATVANHPDVRAAVEIEKPKVVAKPAQPSTLIAMGKGEKRFHLEVLLNTRGGSIQQVVLSDFQHADREGLAVRNSDGTPKPLHLIPGVRVKRTAKIRDQREVPIPRLTPGEVTLSEEEIEHPSYVMYHYAQAADTQPVDTLGNRIWRVVQNEAATDGNSHIVSFETELGAPFYIRITKTFTLKPDEYHIGLSVAITPHERPEGEKAEEFRYQISGPHGMPIEGEWYTPTYRTGVVGWPSTRALEDARSVRLKSGSDAHRATEKQPIRYAAIMVQYFASALAVDDVQPEGQNRDYIEYVRFTPHGEPNKIDKKDQTFLDDLTFRAVSRPIDSSVPVTHSYLLYQGPVKVRLLKQLEGARAVPEETVNRYRDNCNLSTLTDAPMPNWFGRFANAIFWTDIVIFFTNVIHSLLYYLSQVIPNLGICIILITVVVRGMLHPFSRRTMINAKKMQAKQEKLSPEIKKLNELYKDDFQKLQQEKMKLYRQHGINPAAAMGGCFLLLMQMPVFMGLYYALQESIFLRLESVFGHWWIPNLSAPDMLVWWSESIPFISNPDDLGGMIYLGPYFNLLPLVAVALMMWVQSKLMPKSDDPQVQMQQKMMKIMMIMMLFFFYKSPAGLAIYFICSSVWGMIERQLIPKSSTYPRRQSMAAPARRTATSRSQPSQKVGWARRWRPGARSGRRFSKKRKSSSNISAINDRISNRAPPPVRNRNAARGGRRKRRDGSLILLCVLCALCGFLEIIKHKGHSAAKPHVFAALGLEFGVRRCNAAFFCFSCFLSAADRRKNLTKKKSKRKRRYIAALQIPNSAAKPQNLRRF